ncbi:MAG: hypothetical protein ABW221_19135 [Vicinamibacteria bacterium]
MTTTGRIRAVAWPALAAGLAGALLAAAVNRSAPAPTASVARGSEDAFAAGLHRREIPPRGRPQRWTTESARFRFRFLSADAATVEVAVRGQRSPVAVAVDGLVVGLLPPGQSTAVFEVPAGRPVRELELRTVPFEAGGRRLGALLERVAVHQAPRTLPPAGLVLLLAVPAALTAAAAAACGWRTLPASLSGAGLAALAAAVLWPAGVVRSPYAVTLAVLLGAIAAAAGGFGALFERARPGAGRWAFVALLSAGVVQLALGASPLMVVSDAVFHANNLGRVAAGDLFLTSVTQHARPFRFPYGVSFYVLLVPLARAGVDAVALVRCGAALAGVAAAGALFALLVPRGPALAALAVVVLQLLPVTFDVLSFGNLSNAFAQSVTVLFFAWWAGRARATWMTGALLFTLAATAHLSAFVVLVVLAACLAWVRRRDLRADRTRLAAVGAGLLAAGAYYAAFVPLVLGQLGRLGEGGGGAGEGAAAALLRPLLAVLAQWGVPAIALAAFGWPPPDAAGRDLRALWGAGAVLCLVALLSPLDVRYLYALTCAVAVAAAAGCLRLWRSGGAQRALAVLAGLALAAQGLLGVAQALWQRYR